MRIAETQIENNIIFQSIFILGDKPIKRIEYTRNIGLQKTGERHRPTYL